MDYIADDVESNIGVINRDTRSVGYSSLIYRGVMETPRQGTPRIYVVGLKWEYEDSGRYIPTIFLLYILKKGTLRVMWGRPGDCPQLLLERSEKSMRSLKGTRIVRPTLSPQSMGERLVKSLGGKSR